MGRGLDFTVSGLEQVADLCEQGNETLVPTKRRGISWLTEERLL